MLIEPFWPVCVLLLDTLLVGDARDWAARCVIALTLAWLAAQKAEYGFGYGLYKAAYFDGELPVPSVLVRPALTVCDCAAPPCPLLSLPFVWAPTYFVFNAVVFLLDFRFTRSFRDHINEQLSLIAAAVSVSERSAVSLSRYDVDEAQDIVQGTDGESLPPALRQAYVVLMENLRSYKPYQGRVPRFPVGTTCCKSRNHKRLRH
eukprot:gene13005-biopygen5677